MVPYMDSDPITIHGGAGGTIITILTELFHSLQSSEGVSGIVDSLV